MLLRFSPFGCVCLFPGVHGVAFSLVDRSSRLQEEFMRKRVNGKLDANAVGALKQWWISNFVWPYPTVRHASAGVGVESSPTDVTHHLGHRKPTSRNFVG